MKNNTLHFVSLFCYSLAIAIARSLKRLATCSIPSKGQRLLEAKLIALVVVGAMGTAQGQDTVPQLDEFDSNGLFTPTSAQRFFEKGRFNMEREIEILRDPEHYFGEDILQINTIDIKVIEESESSKPIDNFPKDSPRY